MAFGLSKNKSKGRQETSQTETSTYNPNADFLNRTQTGLDQALGLMGGYQRTSQEDIDRFANPYLEEVGAQTSRAINRSRDVTANNLDAQAAKAGAFGNTGWALLRGESGRGYADAEASALANINAGGYDRALGAAMSENDAASGFDLSALQTYLQGLGLLNFGTTTSTGSGLNKTSGTQTGFTGSFYNQPTGIR